MQLALQNVNCIYTPKQMHHVGFTSLVQYKGYWYCAFREGSSHMSRDGKITIMQSRNGRCWKKITVLSKPHADLRDPKLIVYKQQLHITAGQRLRTFCRTLIWHSCNGKDWSPAKALTANNKNTWLWQPIRYNTILFGFAYPCGKPYGQPLQWMQEHNSHHMKCIKTMTDVDGFANEVALTQDADGIYALLRRDPEVGLYGVCTDPTVGNWQWSALAERIGGPSILRVQQQSILCYRRYQPRVCLVLSYQSNSEAKKSLILPSGGDCSYAGMTVVQGNLWISYYSSHQGRSRIYIAHCVLLDDSE